MAEYYDVSIKVTLVKGPCRCGHKLGDEWIIREKDPRTPEGIDARAFWNMWPTIYMLMYGASPFYGFGAGVASGACTCEGRPIRFELRAVPADNS